MTPSTSGFLTVAKFESHLANAYFLLVFPGLLVIYLLKAQGILDFERGYTSAICLMAAASLPVMVAFSSLRGIPAAAVITFVCLITYVGTTVAFQYCCGRGYRGLPEVAHYYTIALIQYAGLFAIGFSMRKLTIRPAVLRLILWSIATIAVYYSIGGEYFYFRFSDDYFSSYPSYQGIALGVLILGLATIATSPGRFGKSLDSIVLLTVLFLIGARTELVAAIAALALILVLRPNRLIMGSLIAAVTVFLLLALEAEESLQPLSRQLELLNISESTSVMGRVEFNDAGLGRIADNPIRGDFAGQIRDFGEIGTYQHNLLDVWRQFGLFGFTLFAALHIFAIASAVLIYRRMKTTHALFVLVVLLVTTISILFSKAFGYSAVAFSWGLAFSQYREMARADPLPRKT